MNFPERCIQRPVFTIVLTVILVITGLISFGKLPVRHLPNIDKPIVHISTEFDGASPELVEKEITIPIENALSGISGIDSMGSTSLLGKSRVNIEFQLGVDINEVVAGTNYPIAHYNINGNKMEAREKNNGISRWPITK